MSSDNEIDDLTRFETAKQRELAKKAGLDVDQFEEAELSDEEVMGLDNSESDSDSGQDAYYNQDEKTIESKRKQVNREIEDNWGQTRDNYFGGEDDLGESDAASEEEEQEALRLHQRELEEMDASDFVDEDDMEGWKNGAAAIEEEETDKKFDSFDISTMSSQERKELIEERFPAVMLLSQQLGQCDTWAKELENNTELTDDLKELGKSALETYRGMICAYFALFTDRIQKGDFQSLSRLEEHPVNEGLLMARQMWLDFNDISSKAAKLESKHNSNKDAAPDSDLVEHSIYHDAASQLLSSDSDKEASESQSQSEDEDSDEVMDEVTSESEDEFAIAKPSAKSAKSKNPLVVNDFDETVDTIEQQARAKNKQSLRFYTSQISKLEKSTQKGATGDEDIPYREREFERRQRLMAEARQRGLQAKDKFGDDDDFNSDDETHATNDENNEALQRYLASSASSSAKKAMKLQRHAEALEAARKGNLEQYLAENPNIDKRAINYQIEKNKGLTKKRKKENRNARVKKRVRYEQAKKKLKGIRREYKEPTGPYQGELTGIRKNVSHSTHFKG